MQEDGSNISPWTAENLDRKDLLSMWKSITHALISTGHVAELHQELGHASRTGREDLSSGGQWAVESCYDPALLSNKSLQTAANSTENNRSACGYDDEESIDEDTVMSSSGESDIEDDDLCDISPNFIAEAADLSHHHTPLLSFEDILAQEESLLPDDGLDDVAPSIGKSSTTEAPCPRTPAPTPSWSESNQAQWLNSQHNWADTDGQDGLVERKETISPQPTSSPRKPARSIETGRLRLSDKKDLTPSEISVVARRLIRNDSVIYFLNNCRLIYESLMPSMAQQPLVCNNNNSIEESVIAAFDTVQNLANGKHIYRLLLRFAYIHLVRVIDIYRAAAAKDRVEGQVSREVGQRDSTVAIDMYLAAKKDSKGGLSRSKLSDYYRRGRRWSFLTGPSPISVFVLTPAADTIMYVLPPLLYLVETKYFKGRTIPLRTRLFSRLLLTSGTAIRSSFVS
jgi:hypothetical protein